MAFTYDTSTNRGKVRLLIADTDSADYVFEDSEIDAFLDLQENNVYEAAAVACETWARSVGKQSKSRSHDDGGGKIALTRYSMDELLKMANQIRRAQYKGTIQTSEIQTTSLGDLLDTYSPVWQDIEE